MAVALVVGAAGENERLTTTDSRVAVLAAASLAMGVQTDVVPKRRRRGRVDHLLVGGDRQNRRDHRHAADSHERQTERRLFAVAWKRPWS